MMSYAQRVYKLRHRQRQRSVKTSTQTERRIQGCVCPSFQKEKKRRLKRKYLEIVRADMMSYASKSVQTSPQTEMAYSGGVFAQVFRKEKMRVKWKEQSYICCHTPRPRSVQAIDRQAYSVGVFAPKVFRKEKMKVKWKEQSKPVDVIRQVVYKLRHRQKWRIQWACLPPKFSERKKGEWKEKYLEIVGADMMSQASKSVQPSPQTEAAYSGSVFAPHPSFQKRKKEIKVERIMLKEGKFPDFQ